MHANKSSNPFVICTHSVGLQTGARAPKTSTSKNLTRRMTGTNSSSAVNKPPPPLLLAAQTHSQPASKHE